MSPCRRVRAPNGKHFTTTIARIRPANPSRTAAAKAPAIVSMISTSVKRFVWQVASLIRHRRPKVNNEMAMRADFQFKICYLCSLAQVDICRLPVEMGHCNGYAVQERRWYYDDERGTCISFIYSGCSGNQNNFRSFEACTNQCGSKTLPPATWQLTPIHSTSECILRTLSIRLRRNLNLL